MALRFIGVGSCRQLFGKDKLQLHMGRDQTPGPLMPRAVCVYARPPIASLRHPAFVARRAISVAQARAILFTSQPVSTGLSEGKAWERRHDDMERVLRPSP